MYLLYLRIRYWFLIFNCGFMSVYGYCWNLWISIYPYSISVVHKYDFLHLRDNVSHISLILLCTRPLGAYFGTLTCKILTYLLFNSVWKKKDRTYILEPKMWLFLIKGFSVFIGMVSNIISIMTCFFLVMLNKKRSRDSSNRAQWLQLPRTG